MTVRQLLRRPFVNTPYAEQASLAGRHVIVTGTSAGSLGFETALTLARWGALVVVTTRSNTDAIIDSLKSQLQNDGIDTLIVGRELDLCDAGSVKQFSQWYLQNHGERLDILVNNAGIHLDLMAKWKEPTLSADGHEIQWRTNYLGTAHLTHSLMPLLQQTGEKYGDARIVNVGSQIHAKAKNEALFDPNTSYNSWKFYGMSKLALIHFSNEINRRFAQANNLQSYCLHPGGSSGTYTEVASKGFANAPIIGFLRKLGAPIERLFMSTAEEGAQTQLYCATSPGAAGGHYYVNCAVGEASPETEDKAVAGRLWGMTQEWLQTLTEKR